MNCIRRSGLRILKWEDVFVLIKRHEISNKRLNLSEQPLEIAFFYFHTTVFHFGVAGYFGI